MRTTTRRGAQPDSEPLVNKYIRDESGMIRPVPDPTELTTRQVIRETDALREIIETRLDAMDKAVELIQRKVDREPSISQVQDKLDSLAELIKTQLHERDERYELLKSEGIRSSDMLSHSSIERHEVAIKEIYNLRDQVNLQFAGMKDNLAIALQGSKEAVGKTEVNFTKELDAMKMNSQTETAGLRQQIDDLKGRQDIGSGRHSGGRESVALMISIIIAVSALVSILSFFILHH